MPKRQSKKQKQAAAARRSIPDDRGLSVLLRTIGAKAASHIHDGRDADAVKEFQDMAAWLRTVADDFDERAMEIGSAMDDPPDPEPDPE